MTKLPLSKAETTHINILKRMKWGDPVDNQWTMHMVWRRGLARTHTHRLGLWSSTFPPAQRDAGLHRGLLIENTRRWWWRKEGWSLILSISKHQKYSESVLHLQLRRSNVSWYFGPSPRPVPFTSLLLENYRSNSRYRIRYSPETGNICIWQMHYSNSWLDQLKTPSLWPPGRKHMLF